MVSATEVVEITEGLRKALESEEIDLERVKLLADNILHTRTSVSGEVGGTLVVDLMHDLTLLLRLYNSDPHSIGNQIANEHIAVLRK